MSKHHTLGEMNPMPMAAKTQDAAGETGTMCVCGHEQAKHYFGDEMHTACQAQSVSSREPCRCREYLPVQPPATPRETAIAAPTGEVVTWAVMFDGRVCYAPYDTETEANARLKQLSWPVGEGGRGYVAALALAAPSAPQEPRGEPSEGMVERAWLSECERDPRLKTVDAKSVAGEKAAIRSILRAALSTGGRDAD